MTIIAASDPVWVVGMWWGIAVAVLGVVSSFGGER
jgi:hypothetical protein